MSISKILKGSTLSAYALASSTQAMEDAGFTQSSYDPDRFGVIFGSGIEMQVHRKSVPYLLQR